MHAGPVSVAPSEASDLRLRCGTLVYTRAGLFTLFSWLLWGDFCFSLMENIWPNILPLMLKSQGAPNIVLSIVITVIPSVMNFVLNPIISTISDRHRGPRGRRIPFLLAATPFITIFLILMGFSRELGAWLHQGISAFYPGHSSAGVTITLIAVLVAGFRFFELFVNTVFWYLFNDVVPVAYMGRFLGFFRIAGSLAGAGFNFFLFKYAESHTSMIFLGVALLYGTMFFLMCLNVKEGTYPAPDKMGGEKSSPMVYVKTFFRECFTHRIFRLVFTYNAFSYMGNAANAFMIFAAFSIGLTLDDVGKVAAGAAMMGILLMYPMGALVDRFNPIRMMIVAQIGAGLALSAKLVFLFYDFDKTTAFWVYAAAAGLAIPMTVANTAASMPMLMRIFPHERFGQFCAANAMCGAIGTMTGGFLAAWFLDNIKGFSTTENFYYRFTPLWSAFFMLMAAGTTYLLLREWKRLGGAESYRPPVPNIRS